MIRISKEWIYKALVFIVLFYNTIVYLIVEVLNKLPVIKNIAPAVVPVIVFILIIMAFNNRSSSFQKIQGSDWLFLVVLLLIISFSYLIYTDNRIYIDNTYWKMFFTASVPFYLIGIILDFNEDTKNFLGSCSNLAIVISGIYIYYTLNYGHAEMLNEDNMTLAYSFLPVVMMSFLYAKEKKSIVRWIFPVFGLLLILSMGTRGPVLIALAYIVYLLILRIFREKSIKKVFFLCIILIIATYVSINFIEILTYFNRIISNMGLSTRVIDRFLSQNMLLDKDRSSISTILWKKINERPILGYGIAGEWKMIGWNAHNMYLSILSNFGIIAGGIIIIWMIVKTVKAYIVCKDAFIRDFIFIWICLVYIHGFFGGDYLNSDVFFLLGLTTNIVRSVKKGELFNAQ